MRVGNATVAVEAIARLHARSEREVPRQQRHVEVVALAPERMGGDRPSELLARKAIKHRVGLDPNALLYALDAETGRELYSSNKLISSFTHFNQPVVAGGQVYVCTWDGKVYAIGLKK